MLKSMTAYGRASLKNSLGVFTAEIQSVNRKFLEVNSYLPSEFARFDNEIKKSVSALVARGLVNVKLAFLPESKTTMAIRPNIPLAKQLKNAWDEIAKQLKTEDVFELEFLQNEKNLMIYTEDLTDESLYLESILTVLSEAMRQLVAMKDKEGQELQRDILVRLGKLRSSIEGIDRLAPDAVLRFRKKLIDRIQEAVPGAADEERLLREVAIYAERVDIVEEITRFRSHLSQFSDLIVSSHTSIGKTLEFIIQELNRETNTIGSKASDVEVTRYVVEIKSELERIREQIQNVE